MALWLTLPDEPDPVPITNLFDEDGEEVGRWDEAERFVAGPLSSGEWMAARCEDYIKRLLS